MWGPASRRSSPDAYGAAFPKLVSRPGWTKIRPNYYEEMVSAGPNFGDNVGNKLLQMLGAQTRFSAYPSRP